MQIVEQQKQRTYRQWKKNTSGINTDGPRPAATFSSRTKDDKKWKFIPAHLGDIAQEYRLKKKHLQQTKQKKK